MGLFSPSTQKDLQKKLASAIRDGNIGRMKKWVDRGASTFLATDGYETALRACVMHGFHEGVEFCLSLQPKIENEPPFLIRNAVYNCSTTTIKLLLDYGFDPDYAADYEGTTALHIAAQQGNDRVVRILLLAGANPAAADAFGRTPADEADQKHPRLADYIRAYGRKALPAPQASGGWKKVSDDEICHIGESAVTGYRLTEIFNFARQSYHSIARNLDTGQETQVAKSFGEFSDTTMIDKAAAELAQQGGNTHHIGNRLSKTPVTFPAGGLS